MASLNKITVIGNVGSDPEMRFTPNGKPLTSFRLATNRFYTAGDGERKKETEWFDIIAWGKQAESCNQFLNKGQRAYVEGRLHTRSWDGQDGQKRFRVEIHANQVIFLDRRAASAVAGAEVTEGEDLAESIEAEDLPFE